MDYRIPSFSSTIIIAKSTYHILFSNVSHICKRIISLASFILTQKKALIIKEA